MYTDIDNDAETNPKLLIDTQYTQSQPIAHAAPPCPCPVASIVSKCFRPAGRFGVTIAPLTVRAAAVRPRGPPPCAAATCAVAAPTTAMATCGRPSLTIPSCRTRYSPQVTEPVDDESSWLCPSVVSSVLNFLFSFCCVLLCLCLRKLTDFQFEQIAIQIDALIPNLECDRELLSVWVRVSLRLFFVYPPILQQRHHRNPAFEFK